jgi:predicted DNA-binding protein (MmcQ/YjbR family)
MNASQARRFALSLPGSTEAPHFEYPSFRVRGKLFATVPPDGRHLHVFVDEHEARASVPSSTSDERPMDALAVAGRAWHAERPRA